ncbi:putative F-box protein At2g16290 [Brassica rapa]|uniref:KIB1-4 beta-propeller domain-containing protein n=1 Tax=Brassica campestris TaxID=3711 RepID=M4F892_BRACM|nr:putative F-box protein At2g16290 [Brassica rapa]
MADWSLLPKDLLELISGRSQTCFEIVHFRSVCSSWRSAIPRPSYRLGLGLNSLLTVFNHEPRFESHTQCILKRIAVFLFRFQTPFGTDFLLIEVTDGKSGEQILMSPFQNSAWRYKDVTTLNTLNSQIIPLGYYYKINFYAITTIRHRTRSESYTKRVAFLPLDGKEFAVVAGVLGDLMMYRSCDKGWTKLMGFSYKVFFSFFRPSRSRTERYTNRVAFLPLDGKEFAVVAGVFGDLMMYRSCDKGWTKLEGHAYGDMVSFKGKFYVVDMSGQGHVFVIEPSFEITEIQAVTLSHEIYEERLVVSGDELFLVQRFTLGMDCNEYEHSWFRLFRLEEDGQRRWVRINDIKDRVVVLGWDWSLCCSAKELPGMKGNSVVFNEERNNHHERIFVFDLKTMKTSNAFTEWRGYMFGENQESLLSCGILTHRIQIPADGFYDSSSESEIEPQ